VPADGDKDAVVTGRGKDPAAISGSLVVEEAESIVAPESDATPGETATDLPADVPILAEQGKVPVVPDEVIEETDREKATGEREIAVSEDPESEVGAATSHHEEKSAEGEDGQKPEPNPPPNP